MAKTDCKKCGAPMPPVPRCDSRTPFERAQFVVTGYRCSSCEHWNNLKNRHAVALGKLGGAAGKGSPARRRAALKANRTRWRNHRKNNLKKDLNGS